MPVGCGGDFNERQEEKKDKEIKGAITYVIGSLFLKEAGVAMREIVWFFREKDYIRYPLEVLCFIKVGESLFSRKQEKK